MIRKCGTSSHGWHTAPRACAPSHPASDLFSGSFTKERTMMRIGLLLALIVFSVSAMSGEGAKVGDAVPDISAPDENGKDVKLSDYKGKNGLIIFFYPRADTPG